jgi:arylsulfatase A-like enzyme
MRGDYLGTYGFKGNVTPHIDSFANKSAVFDFAIAPAPWTLPSIASMFTGLNVRSHGITFFSYIDPKYRYGRGDLPENATTVAELFQQAGYRTAAFSANTLIAKSLGFAQGFDDFKDTVNYKSYTASSIFEDVTSWLSKNGHNNFFMYLHYMDVHGPYRFKRSDFNSLYNDKLLGEAKPLSRYRSLKRNQYMRVRPWMSLKQRHSSKTLKAGYVAGIKNFDRKFGKLINWLENEGYLQNSLIILTADHGEGFFEHGFLGHGNSMHKEVTQVPLIVFNPKNTQSGTRLKNPYSLLDIKASLVSMYGLSNQLPGHQLDRLEGVDFTPFLHGEESVESSHRGIFSSGHMTHPACFSFTTKKSKAIIRCPQFPTYEIKDAHYDLEFDSTERDNLYSQNSPEQLEFAAEAFTRFSKLPAPQSTKDSNGKENSDLIKKLKSLGYLAGSS